jgi:DNA polymerase III alpha subunit
MCSWINSYIGKNEHLSPCLTEAQRMGVKVYQPKWGAAFNKTQVYQDGIILGTSSLKFCNEQMADDLTQLYQSKKYNNFIELLNDIDAHTTINSRQLEVLIGSNFFEEFGKNKYLSSLKDLYEELGGKTQIKKDKLQEYIDKYGITEDIISRHAGKETAKLYKDIDMSAVITELSSNIPNKSFSVKEQVQFEVEKIQHVSYINPQVSDKFWAVVHIKTYSDETKPYLTLHNIQTGEKKSTKIKKGKSFIENPFNLYSIIKVDNFAQYPKTKQIGGKWVATDEMQDILESWVVIQR